MLLVGLAATPAEVEVMDGEYEARDWAAMELGRAMMLLLPALDANDRQKTQSAIGFYLAVFSNCVTVRGALPSTRPGWVSLCWCDCAELVVFQTTLT